MVDNLGQWESFRAFLACAAGYDLAENPRAEQALLETWVLCPAGSRAQDIQEVFIRPDDSLLPVYTSSVLAAMAAESYQERHGTALALARVPCLDCLLSGLGKAVPQGILAGALYCEQWRIALDPCPRITDVPDDWTLEGCAEKEYGPVWVEKRWGKEGC
jgi:hypothetical protein